MIDLMQQSQPRAIPPHPRGHLAMSGESFDCYIAGGGVLLASSE